MPLDPSLVGRSYPASPPYLVGREKIREFADSIGDPDPVYRDPEAAKALGYPDVLAPPTFAIMLCNLYDDVVINDPELGMDYSRVVHGDQRFRYERPILAGDRLTCTFVIEQIMGRAGHEFVTTRVDIATDAGEPVVAAWTTLIVRGGTA